MASQEASAVSPNSTLSRKGLSQEGSNPHSGNCLVSSQAGTNLVSTQSGRRAVWSSTRLRASQASQASKADSGTPEVDSKVSMGSQASAQVARCSFRHRAPQGSQENSATPQASRAISWEGNTSPSTNGMANNTPRALTWKNLNLSGSLTCPANL